MGCSHIYLDTLQNHSYFYYFYGNRNHNRNHNHNHNHHIQDFAMKERLTFLVSRPEDTRPENCMSRPAELKILALPKATREDRYTIDFASLPAAVKLLLRNIDQGHLIWSSGAST